jgi:MFS transporter, ACS family, tartrate transporter
VCLLVTLTLQPGTLITIVLLGVGNACMLAFVTSFWAIPSAFLGESAGAAATGLINCVAMMGGFAGPYLIGYLSSRSHSFHSSFIFMMLAAVAAGISILAVRARPLASTHKRSRIL